MLSVRSTSFALWGGLASVVTQAESRHAHSRAVDAVTTWLDEVDRAASAYRDDSELATVNRAYGSPTAISAVLRGAILAAITAADLTDGLVDPTIGTVTLADRSPTIRVGRRSTYRDISLRDDESGSWVSLPAGTRLDLGATAKAWAADGAAARAALSCDGGVLVNLLGDIATFGRAPVGGWAIAVTDDHREGPTTTNEAAQTIAIAEGGLATSSTTVRRTPTADGAFVAHIVDPRTLVPVVPTWRTVSVAAANCLTANAASTAAIILGEAAPRWLAHAGLPARLVHVNGAIERTHAWPAPLEEARAS